MKDRLDQAVGSILSATLLLGVSTNATTQKSEGRSPSG